MQSAAIIAAMASVSVKANATCFVGLLLITFFVLYHKRVPFVHIKFSSSVSPAYTKTDIIMISRQRKLRLVHASKRASKTSIGTKTTTTRFEGQPGESSCRFSLKNVFSIIVDGESETELDKNVKLELGTSKIIQLLEKEVLRLKVLVYLKCVSLFAR